MTVCVATPADAPLLLDALRRRRPGVVQTHFDLPASPWDLSGECLTCIAPVVDVSTATAAVDALLRGADVVLLVDLDQPWPGLDELLEDATRLAPVIDTLDIVGGVGRAAAAPEVPSPAALSADQRQILELLATGVALPEVAATLFMSLRTAERRVSAARRLLGVRTTAEALAIAMAGAT